MGEITTRRRFIFEGLIITISCRQIWLVETDGYCFQRFSVKVLVAPISYGQNHHYWGAFWDQTKNVSWSDASQSVKRSSKSRVFAQKSVFKPRTHWDWIQLWAKRCRRTIIIPCLSSWLYRSGSFSEADSSSNFIDNKQCASKNDYSLLSLKLYQSRNEQQISCQFRFCQGPEDATFHKSEDQRRTWLQIQKRVGVWKMQFPGGIRLVRERIVPFSTSAGAWKFRRTVQKQHIVLHWFWSITIWLTSRNRAQSEIG